MSKDPSSDRDIHVERENFGTYKVFINSSQTEPTIVTNLNERELLTLCEKIIRACPTINDRFTVAINLRHSLVPVVTRRQWYNKSLDKIVSSYRGAIRVNNYDKFKTPWFDTEDEAIRELQVLEPELEMELLKHENVQGSLAYAKKRRKEIRMIRAVARLLNENPKMDPKEAFERYEDEPFLKKGES